MGKRANGNGLKMYKRDRDLALRKAFKKKWNKGLGESEVFITEGF